MMKRLRPVLLAVFLLALFSGCTTKAEPEATPQASVEIIIETYEPEFAPSPDWEAFTGRFGADIPMLTKTGPDKTDRNAFYRWEDEPLTANQAYFLSASESDFEAFTRMVGKAGFVLESEETTTGHSGQLWIITRRFKSPDSGKSFEMDYVNWVQRMVVVRYFSAYEPPVSEFAKGFQKYFGVCPAGLIADADETDVDRQELDIQYSAVFADADANAFESKRAQIAEAGFRLKNNAGDVRREESTDTGEKYSVESFVYIREEEPEEKALTEEMDERELIIEYAEDPNHPYIRLSFSAKKYFENYSRNIASWDKLDSVFGAGAPDFGAAPIPPTNSLQYDDNTETMVVTMYINDAERDVYNRLCTVVKDAGYRPVLEDEQNGGPRRLYFSAQYNRQVGMDYWVEYPDKSSRIRMTFYGVCE